MTPTPDAAATDAALDGNDALACGVPPGRAVGVALRAAAEAHRSGLDRAACLDGIARAVTPPFDHDPAGPFAPLADFLRGQVEEELHREAHAYTPRVEPAPFASWCDDADPTSLGQMGNAMRLPSTVRGALMPDAHVGYGLPIGGVLATRGTVVPYAVGVDIACRMKLSVYELDPATIDDDPGRLEQALLRRTVFGTGSRQRKGDLADHDVLDHDRWTVDPVTSALRDRATVQLGTSGSGNHFVEFGVLTLDAPDLGLAAGRYLALLSHSGSRGPGALVAAHYTKRARAAHPDLPPELSHLAWLDLDSDDGRGYWRAMELMGDFAAANHTVIHDRVAEFLGAERLADVENHHNYAWLEEHDGEQVVVHRKGATPAARGVLGVIPGSMATPAFVVRGLGVEASLRSASHGAGRLMSRTEASRRFRWSDVRPRLEAAGVRLLSAGIDENPGVYKDIHAVMAHQRDLVDTVARFDPRIVRMAEAGQRPED